VDCAKWVEWRDRKAEAVISPSRLSTAYPHLYFYFHIFFVVALTDRFLLLDVVLA